MLVALRNHGSVLREYQQAGWQLTYYFTSSEEIENTTYSYKIKQENRFNHSSSSSFRQILIIIYIIEEDAFVGH